MLQGLGEPKAETLPGSQKNSSLCQQGRQGWTHTLAVLDGALEIPWSVPHFSGDEGKTQKGSDLPKATWLTEQS